MAKKSMINRELKRLKLVTKYKQKRDILRNIIQKVNNYTEEERIVAQRKLQQLPRDSSPVRVQRRCSITGRPHAVYKKFGLSRNKLRELSMEGYIPGIRKARW